MDFERQCEGYDIETMTDADLLAWANGLQVCRFEANEEGAVCAGKKSSIRLDFGRFDDSVPGKGGMRHVGIYAEDERGDYHGWCAGYADLRKAAEVIERRASELGLMSMQLSLF
ncbi:hypothetical protein [Gordonibacter massiliensis (ex Traore et al. 2017)]|uniref:hypothetical protein n=1 Tax=Gordonibacter massiliensis (ex Traore et al. 2017) TaxID=1841863 RepID=UPI001C8C1A38|nr:hypothetical protein [Gordonibacter massiliensis (ex Traore et al. 2017)]MBX9032651.1 hypothetical protein [Gordonibacter massiliensis (ex Traore et al. 2017)]